MNHIADNHEALLDYLYEEGDPAERLTIARHLQECAACSVAVLEFQNVRGMLRDWAPPASDLGFRVVQDGRPLPGAVAGQPLRNDSRWSGIATRSQRMPWLQAAAAVVLFAAGMAVSQVNVQYRNGEVVASWGSAPVATGRGASITLRPESVNDTPAAPQPGAMPQTLPGAQNTADTEALLQRVRAMIDQSEQRQQRELALRLSQVTREVDTQHQADLLRIQQDFGQQQDATMEYLVRTSGGVK